MQSQDPEVDSIIYNQLLDTHLTDEGVQQARLVQPLLNEFRFPENIVYCSPRRRTMETLCNALDSHPQKSSLKIVLLPLAAEFVFSYENIPPPMSQLKQEFEEKVIEGFGFKSIDYSLLNNDNLYFLRQLEIDPELLEHYLEVCEPYKDGDLVPAFKQLYRENVERGATGNKRLALEPNRNLYNRCQKLRL